jgi:NAD(P)-dependent dehydrogenase (short-subunit alcohol dehydrogenase family)
MSASNFVGEVPKPKDESTPINVLVTGASKGIGLELVSQYASSNKSNNVFAGVRDIKSNNIVTLQLEYPNIFIIPLDITEDKSIEQSVKYVTSKVDHLDLLINNAGIMGLKGLPTQINRTDLLNTINTNVAGVLCVTNSYLPLLRKNTSITKPAKVLNISTGTGSLTYAPTVIKLFGPNVSTSYNISKSALNHLTIHYANEINDIIFIAASPGWVKTEMSPENDVAPVTVKDAAQGLRALIETKTLKDTGSFVDNITHGTVIPF